MGSEDGFEFFLVENFDRIRRVLGVAVGDPDRGEELAQEGFARAYARWSTVSRMERPVAWVYVVAINKVRRDFRRERPQASAPVSRPVEEDPAGRVVTSLTLKAALEELPPRQRAVVVLRCLADLSTAEVAEALRCAPGTVKATLHAALRHLRIDLEDGELE